MGMESLEKTNPCLYDVIRLESYKMSCHCTFGHLSSEYTTEVRFYFEARAKATFISI